MLLNGWDEEPELFQVCLPSKKPPSFHRYNFQLLGLASLPCGQGFQQTHPVNSNILVPQIDGRIKKEDIDQQDWLVLYLSKSLKVWIDIETGNPLTKNSRFRPKWYTKNMRVFGVENWLQFLATLGPMSIWDEPCYLHNQITGH